MKNSVQLFFLFFLVVFSACTTSPDGVSSSPFGVCAHLQSGSEHRQMPKNLQMMRDAGIRWVRVDFSWSGIESPRGTWTFDHIDRVVEETEKAGLTVSALLLYNVAWANPAYRHLDLWLQYVEKTVTRYKDKVRYWEVWNEPNLFWENPNGADYAILLEATYRKIKEIDPTLTVLYGGTSGIPVKFLEESLKAGSGAFFDVVNIHPYRGRLNTMDKLIHYQEDLVSLRKLMEQYHIGDKRIWITEMGWSTWTTLNRSTRGLFEQKQGKIDKSEKKGGFAVLFDTTYQSDSNLSVDTIRSWFSDDQEIDIIQIEDLKQGNLLKYEALFVPPWEEYETGWIFDAIIPHVFSYMHKGGKLYFYGDGAITEEEQSSYLSQSILLSLRLGVERYFWYEFQSPEDSPFDREDHFGLVSGQLEPKPAYTAYAVLAKIFPEGSLIDSTVAWNENGFCRIKWDQKDGTCVWAVWNPGESREVNVKIGKDFRYALDLYGNKLPVTRQTAVLSIGPETVYFVGPESLTFK
ncbi:MAG: beta-galactosidase [Massilibacteroides sp.]|nr:beta-galactosidase [Massilibacteroides sp.]MDD4661466.1 beta-galactosidase [Massilibacteroides sp.]